MNLHLIPNEKFSEKFIQLIEYDYPSDTNLVYMYPKGKFDIGNYNCCKKIKSFREIDFKKLDKGDKLYVHGFYDYGLIRFLCLHYREFKNNEFVMVIWGADIYNAILLNKGEFHPVLFINELFKKYLLGKCHIFMTFACTDYDIAKKWYKVNGKQFDCLYPPNVDIAQLDDLKLKKRPHDKCRILIGNSAAKTNNHIDAMRYLEHFKDENIEIVCILSYGGQEEYIKQVINYGREKFGDKFVPILNYLPPSEYSRLLSEIDIAVFNHNRQQATANIEILSYLGKKLFIRSDTTTWDHYVIRDKCSFYDTKSIQNMKYDDFVAFSEESIQNNVAYFRKIWDLNYVKSLWDDVMGFEYKDEKN